MIVDVLQGRNVHIALQQQWNAVYDADPDATYFMSHKWLFGTENGAGRWSFILAAKKEGTGEYVAFLPIRLNSEFDKENFHNEVNLSGNYTSDYNGFICRPEYDAEAIPAIAGKLYSFNWRRLRLLNLNISDQRRELFLQSFPEDTFTIEPVNVVNPDGIDNGVCPSVDLLPDWDDFLRERLSSNMRQKIRRGLRQVEGSDDYRFTHVNRDTLDRDLLIYERLWAAKWGARKGKNLKLIQETQQRLFRHAFDTRSLFMPMLWHKGRCVSVLVIFVDSRKKSFNFYAAGRDETFKGPPTGLIIHGFAIRLAIEVGMKRYDFLRGNETYKYSFGTEDRPLTNLLISTRSEVNLGERLDPRCLRPVTRIAAERYRDGEVALARRGWEQVVEADAGNHLASYLFGIAATKTGEFEIAAKHFKSLAKKYPDSAKLRYRLGDAYLSGKAYGKAADTFLDELETNGTNPHIWCRLGDALLKLDQLDAAIQAYSKALSLRPEFKRAEAALPKALKIRWALRPEQLARRAKRHAAIGLRAQQVLDSGGDRVAKPAPTIHVPTGTVQPEIGAVQMSDTALATLMSGAKLARPSVTIPALNK